MAIIMDINQSKFFDHVLTNFPTQLGFVKSLDIEGYKFQVNLFGITATKGSKSAILTLNTSTSNLMKASFKTGKAPAVEQMATQKIATFVDELYSDWLGTPVPQAPIPKVSAAKLSKDSDSIYSDNTKPTTTVGYGIDPAVDTDMTSLTEMLKKSYKKPVPKGVVMLKDATAIGQMVKGTTPGSQYRVVAFNDRVKVATKIDGSHLSIRVETTPHVTSGDMALINSSGINWNGTYGSMHIDAGSEVMVRRTLGAFLFGTGIEFTEQVTAGDIK